MTRKASPMLARLQAEADEGPSWGAAFFIGAMIISLFLK